MRSYARIWGALFAGSLGASVVGLDALNLVVFPSAVGLYWARGKGAQSFGVILCAVLSALVSFGSALPMINYALLAAAGILLGTGIVRQWPYGRIVALTAGYAYALLAGQYLAFWDAAQKNARAAIDFLAARALETAEQAQSGNQDAIVRQMDWMRTHGPDVAIGFSFWPVLIGACMAVSLTGRLLRRAGDAVVPRGTFAEMRTSEWLVWLAIVVAASWYFERSNPNELQRLLTVNAAVVLAAIYWVNGLSVVAYALQVLQPGPIVAVASAMLLFWFWPVLGLTGLFDTWADFRRAAAKLAAWRAQSTRQGNGRQGPHDTDEK